MTKELFGKATAAWPVRRFQGQLSTLDDCLEVLLSAAH